MCRLLDAIDGVGKAADTLTRICARRGALVDATANDNPFVGVLRRHWSAAALTPNDMLAALGRLK